MDREKDRHTHTTHTRTHTHTHTDTHTQRMREKEREKWTHTNGQIKATFRGSPVQNTYSIRHSPRVERKNTEDLR